MTEIDILQEISTKIDTIIYFVGFFGFLSFIMNFIQKRWFTS